MLRMDIEQNAMAMRNIHQATMQSLNELARNLTKTVVAHSTVGNVNGGWQFAICYP
jgi:hypothetical protein